MKTHVSAQPASALFPLAQGPSSDWKVGEVVWYSDWNAPRCLIVSRFGSVVEILPEYSARREKRGVADLMTRDDYRLNCRRCSDGFGFGSWIEQMDKVTAIDWVAPRAWHEWRAQHLASASPGPCGAPAPALDSVANWIPASTTPDSWRLVMWAYSGPVPSYAAGYYGNKAVDPKFRGWHRYDQHPSSKPDFWRDFPPLNTPR